MKLKKPFPGRRWVAVPRLVPALALLTASVGLYACTERPKEVTAPKGPAAIVSPNEPLGWDLNENNTPTVASPYTQTVTSSGGYDGLWIFPTPYKVGTGVINPFLAVQNSPKEQGFNTDASPLPYNDTRQNFTNALPLNYVPVIKHGAGFYREIILDTNEANSDDSWKIAIDTFDVWVCNDANAPTFSTYSQFDDTGSNSNCKRVYDLGGKRGYATDALTSGSGKTLDYDILIPEKAFTDAFPDAETKCAYAGVTSTPCGYYVIVKTIMGGIIPGSPPDSTWVTDATFEEFSTIKRPYVSVSKVAHTSYTRTYNWKITKSATPTSLVMYTGESDSSYYTVTVDTTGHTDSAILVTDTVTVSNSSGSAAPIDTVQDQMGPISIDYTCSVGGNAITFPYSLADGNSIICTSTASPPDLTAREDTATVILADTAGGSTFRATAPVLFGAPTTVVNDSVNVVDNFVGTAAIDTLGYATDSTTFNFYHKYTCDQDEGSHKNIASILETGQKDSATVNVSCANLTVTKTVVDSLTRTWNWTINKSATPDTWNLFTGDSATSDYSVALVRTDSTDSNWNVGGAIQVNNTGGVDITLDSLVDIISGAPTRATVSCDSLTIDAGGQLNCTYTAPLPNGTTQKNVVTAYVGTHSFTDTVAVDFSNAVVTEVNDSVHVTDTFKGALGTALGDTTFSYDRQFGCNGDQGVNKNTATITETGQSDSAKVTVNCAQLQVTKTAADSLTRKWTWNINKTLHTGSTTPDTIFAGDSLKILYDVSWDTTGSTDSNYKASGAITVKNQSTASAATVNSLSDLIDGSLGATVDCGSTTFPDTIAASGQLDCTYTASPSSGTLSHDTATATQQNYNYASDGTATASGTTDYSGGADFPAVYVNKVDNCVNVWDLLTPTSPTDSTALNGGSKFCIGDAPLPNTETLTKTFGPNPGEIPLVCGDNAFDNTGYLKTTDTGAEDSSKVSVDIYENCLHNQLTPTQVTCEEFQAGTAPSLDTVYAGFQQGKINQTNPGVFFYYSQVVIPASGEANVSIIQTASPTFTLFGVQQNNQAYVYTSACGSPIQTMTVDPSGSPVTVTITGTPGQLFVIGIKYSTSTVVGSSGGAFPKTYTFTTWVNGVATIDDSLLLVKK